MTPTTITSCDSTYTALRVPQVDGNPQLTGRIRAGQVHQDTAIKLERQCLTTLRRYDAGKVKVAHRARRSAAPTRSSATPSRKDRREVYRETLEDRPWRSCKCGICEHAGIDVAMFRGSERNKRRGFHNLYVFRQRLRQGIGAQRRMSPSTTSRRREPVDDSNQLRTASPRP